VKQGKPLKRTSSLKQKKPMSRGKGLKRTGSLNRSGGLKQSKSLKSTKKRLSPMSDKQKKILEIRGHLRVYMHLTRGGWCEIRVAGCSGNWVDMHERLSRGQLGSAIDKNNIICACRKCHDWVDDNIPEAERLGFYRRRTYLDDKPKYMEIDMSSMQTVYGNNFSYEDPAGSDYTIEDIAIGLSNICRFNGHVPKFYSVAQHSVLVAQALPYSLKMQGLMHDAHEAFMMDCVSPLKRLLPDLQAMETKIEAAVRKRFGLPAELDPLVKEIDLKMLATEQIQLRGDVTNAMESETLDIEIDPWGNKFAAQQFLMYFEELSAQ